MSDQDWWIIFGFMGQLIFMSRFVVQWLSSERRGKSVIPEIFWYLSICGGAVLATYSIYKEDPVFIFGHSLGLFVYVRNLQLVRAEKRRNNSLHDTLDSSALSASEHEQTSNN
jgi:lipid-A-disaccharide synthase-like uncharacterized protein